MFKFWPTYKQYKNWSMPSKLTFIGTFLGVFSFIFTIATYFLSDEILTLIKEPQERLILAGRWEPDTNHPAHSQTLLIGRESAKSFKFRILANNGANTCDVAGVASVNKKGNAVFKDKDNGAKCHIDFALDSDNMSYIVTPNNECSGYCGLGASFDGDYTKQKDFFVKRGVLSELNSGVFSMLVGNWYETFYESMPATFETENLDSFSAKVNSGAVRGMYTLQEGVIMENDEGKIWAAVIVDEKVAYFTNDPEYFKKLPLTIKNWMSRFSEKEIWYVGSA